MSDYIRIGDLIELRALTEQKYDDLVFGVTYQVCGYDMGGKTVLKGADEESYIVRLKEDDFKVVGRVSPKPRQSRRKPVPIAGRVIAFIRATDDRDEEKQRERIDDYASKMQLDIACRYRVDTDKDIYASYDGAESVLIAGLQYFTNIDMWGGATPFMKLMEEQGATIHSARENMNYRPGSAASTAAIGMQCLGF